MYIFMIIPQPWCMLVILQAMYTAMYIMDAYIMVQDTGTITGTGTTTIQGQ